MWVDKQMVADLRAEKARLLADLERERRESAETIRALRNENALLVGETNKQRLAIDRLKSQVAANERHATAANYGITAQMIPDVDWERLGVEPPEE